MVARLAAAGRDGEGREAELGAILRDTGKNDWESILEITGVQSRVRSVFLVFGFSLVLAVLIVLPTLRLRMPGWNPAARPDSSLAKTAMRWRRCCSAASSSREPPPSPCWAARMGSRPCPHGCS